MANDNMVPNLRAVRNEAAAAAVTAPTLVQNEAGLAGQPVGQYELTDTLEFVAWNGTAITGRGPAYTPKQRVRQTAPALITLGDSTGGGGHTDGKATAWPALLAPSRGWSLVNAAVNGVTVTNGDDSRDPAAIVKNWQASVPANYRGRVSLLAGTNDWFLQYQLGQPNEYNATTYHGALKMICNGVLSQNPDATFAFITPLWRADEFNADGTPKRNANGHTLEMFRVAMRTVATFMERLFPGRVQLIDAGRDLKDYLSFPGYMHDDGLHPLPVPGAVLIATYLSQKMN